MTRAPYHPYRHLHSTRLTLGITRLPIGDAWWVPSEDAIVLSSHLLRVERRCALAHELVHAERRDEGCLLASRDGARLARRCERYADQVAARRLMRLEHLGDALMPDLDHAALAADLDVTEHLLRTRLRSLHPVEESWLRSHTGRRHPTA